MVSYDSRSLVLVVVSVVVVVLVLALVLALVLLSVSDLFDYIVVVFMNPDTFFEGRGRQSTCKTFYETQGL